MTPDELIAQQICPIWGTPARVARPAYGADRLQICSFRAGGHYEVVGSVLPRLIDRSVEERVQITSWLVRQRINGQLRPIIDTQNRAAISQGRPANYSVRVDRFFRMLAFQQFDFGVDIVLREEPRHPSERPWGYHIAAWCDLSDFGQVKRFMRHLVEAGLLQNGGSTDHFTLAPEGWRRLDALNTPNRNYAQGFVAMWFDRSMDEIYEHGIAPAIAEAGFEIMRIDAKEHINKIDDEIVAEIRRSRFVVVDMTCGVATMADGREVTFDRGGVYFEAGFAMGLGLPVIWTVRADMVDKLHFDIRQYSHILWEGADDLREKLRNRIVAILGEGPSSSKG